MIKKLGEKIPQIHESCFVPEECSISGDVILKEYANIWFYATIRGDVNKIEIGKYSNVQDGAIIHVDDIHPTIVGDYVTIGHGAKLHGCIINDKALIGIGAIVLDGAEIGENAIVAAGAVVPPNKKIPANTLVVGNPCKIVREVTKEEKEHIMKGCMDYAKKHTAKYMEK